jgi:hypothetical protein
MPVAGRFIQGSPMAIGNVIFAGAFSLAARLDTPFPVLASLSRKRAKPVVEVTVTRLLGPRGAHRPRWRCKCAHHPEAASLAVITGAWCLPANSMALKRLLGKKNPWRNDAFFFGISHLLLHWAVSHVIDLGEL